MKLTIVLSGVFGSIIEVAVGVPDPVGAAFVGVGGKGTMPSDVLLLPGLSFKEASVGVKNKKASSVAARPMTLSSTGANSIAGKGL